jgi:hypothetical protein
MTFSYTQERDLLKEKLTFPMEQFFWLLVFSYTQERDLLKEKLTFPMEQFFWLLCLFII